MQENEITYHQQDSLTTHQDSLPSYIDSGAFLYCFPNDTIFLTNDSVTATSTTTFIPTKEKISTRPKFIDSVFSIFLFCFILSSYLLSKKAKMFLSIPDELFRQKERKSIFSDPVGNEMYVRLLLFIQTIVVLSLFAYFVLHGKFDDNPDFTLSVFFEKIGKICLLLFVFFIYKWFSYGVIGNIFFQKEPLKQWLNNFISLVCLLGIAVFIPVLLIFYVDWMYSFCCFFILFCIFAIIIIVIYRTYVLFFHNMRQLHYLFLYLCAQEIAPLLVLYKGLIYLT